MNHLRLSAPAERGHVLTPGGSDSWQLPSSLAGRFRSLARLEVFSPAFGHHLHFSFLNDFFLCLPAFLSRCSASTHWFVRALSVLKTLAFPGALAASSFFDSVMITVFGGLSALSCPCRQALSSPLHSSSEAEASVRAPAVGGLTSEPYLWVLCNSGLGAGGLSAHLGPTGVSLLIIWDWDPEVPAACCCPFLPRTQKTGGCERGVAPRDPEMQEPSDYREGGGREGGRGEQAGRGTRAIGIERAPRAWEVPQAWRPVWDPGHL